MIGGTDKIILYRNNLIKSSWFTLHEYAPSRVFSLEPAILGLQTVYGLSSASNAHSPTNKHNNTYIYINNINICEKKSGTRLQGLVARGSTPGL